MSRDFIDFSQKLVNAKQNVELRFSYHDSPYFIYFYHTLLYYTVTTALCLHKNSLLINTFCTVYFFSYKSKSSKLSVLTKSTVKCKRSSFSLLLICRPLKSVRARLYILRRSLELREVTLVKVLTSSTSIGAAEKTRVHSMITV